MSGAARAAVVLAAPGTVSLGVYGRLASGRVRVHARREVALGDTSWTAVRDAVRALVTLARARGARPIALAIRAALPPAQRRQLAAEARGLRCQPLVMTAEDERRWLFLGAIHHHPVADGLAAELDADGLALAHWRGRVLAATARVDLADARAGGGVLPGRPSDALLVTGAAAVALLPSSAAERRPRLGRGVVGRLARAQGPRRSAAAALRRLLDWTGHDTALVSPYLLLDGLAATVLAAPIPRVTAG